MTIFIILTWASIFIGSWLDPRSFCLGRTHRDTPSEKNSCLWKTAMRRINSQNGKTKCHKEEQKDDGHFHSLRGDRTTSLGLEQQEG